VGSKATRRHFGFWIRPERVCQVDTYGLTPVGIYSSSDAENYKRAAYFVDRILKGTKPPDLPVERPTKFERIFYLKTANQLRLTIPPNVLVRAQKVIK